MPRVKEPFLEPLLRRRRIQRVLPHVSPCGDCRLLDVGCGRQAKLLRTLEPRIASGVGVDRNVVELRTQRLTTLAVPLTDTLPFATASFDLVTMLAVLEHLDQPEAILAETARVLRPGGGLLLTVPSKLARPILEFLAFRLGIVDAAAIREHKRYYARRDLCAMVAAANGLEVVRHCYFQLGCNNFLFARRV